MADQKYVIQKFNKALHDRGAFSCGVQQIDAWIKAGMNEQIKANRLVVWCASDGEGTLSGLYGLNAHAIKPETAFTLARRKERHDIPVIYLPFIAISNELQGQGLGGKLMAHAINQSVEISEKAGAAAIVLDVLKDDKYDKRMAFYQGIGFAPLGNPPGRMYLSMSVAKASL